MRIGHQLFPGILPMHQVAFLWHRETLPFSLLMFVTEYHLSALVKPYHRHRVEVLQTLLLRRLANQHPIIRLQLSDRQLP